MESEEMNNIEAMLETIWDLHDGISNAINGISRSHSLASVQTLAKLSPEAKLHDEDGMSGFVFVKEFPVVEDDAAMAEARSLGAIRAALESVEHQLELLCTLQTQQRAERNAALGRLKQSRITLSLRLADYEGKKYRFIEEVSRLVSDLFAPEILYDMPGSQPGDHANSQEASSSTLMRMLKSGFAIAMNSPKWKRMDGLLGNVALFAVSMLALLQFHQVAFTTLQEPGQNPYRKSINKIDSRLNVSCQMQYFDVFSARG